MNANSAPGYRSHPDYSVRTEPLGKRVRGLVGDVAVIDSTEVLVMREQNHDPVYYFPKADVRMDLLKRTDHTSHCPFKGDASYWSLSLGGEIRDNAVWSYESPFDEAETITGLLGFYWTAMESWEVDGAVVSAPIA